MCTCILQLKRHCFTLKAGGGASKGFLSWGKVFFQTEIHLLFSQLISCIPNTNWTTVSSIGLDDAQPVPGEVYLLMIVNIIILFITQDSVTYGQCPEKCICKWKGGKETVQCVNASLTKWDNFSLHFGRMLNLINLDKHHFNLASVKLVEVVAWYLIYFLSPWKPNETKWSSYCPGY